MYVLWFARDPLKTYGATIYNIIKTMHESAYTIYDTGALGRPKSRQFIAEMVRRLKIQALFCVSNHEMTQEMGEIAYKIRLPYYGATRDS